MPARALACAMACAMAAGLARAAPPGDWPAYGNDPGGAASTRRSRRSPATTSCAWRPPGSTTPATSSIGIELPESLGWGSPNVGGPLVTAGGLVFVAAGLDHVIRAFDARDGRVLWRHRLPAPGMAVPMTYEADGRQYVVVAAGGNAMAGTAVGDAIVAFRLP